MSHWPLLLMHMRNNCRQDKILPHAMQHDKHILPYPERPPAKDVKIKVCGCYSIFFHLLQLLRIKSTQGNCVNKYINKSMMKYQQKKKSDIPWFSYNYQKYTCVDSRTEYLGPCQLRWLSNLEWVIKIEHVVLLGSVLRSPLTTHHSNRISVELR